jgi:5S rRNA maturation endonuclease (ribonuclease M5)
MSWDSIKDLFLESEKYAKLTSDVIPRIMLVVPQVLQNTAVNDYDIRASCPFHAHSGTSQTLRINLDASKSLGIGFFKCHSCGKSGHFNKIMEHLGMDLVHGEANPELRNVLTHVKMREDFDNEVPDFRRQIMPRDYKWVRHDGVVIPRYALDLVGAELWHRQQSVPKLGPNGKPLKDDKGRFVIDYWADEQRIWMPVFDRGMPVAYVAALDGKREWYSKKYLNARGDWTKQYIWPFEQVMKKIPNHDVITLVEGPADALRLISAGVPAIANLGVSSWTPQKAEIVSCYYSRVVLCLDSDEAGQRAQQVIRSTFNGLIPVSGIVLKGKDPASLSEPTLTKLARHILKEN